eukprot:SM000071S21050  [mRNA]  locus=s71:168957:169923:+ [translate_table: standard]
MATPSWAGLDTGLSDASDDESDASDGAAGEPADGHDGEAAPAAAREDAPEGDGRLAAGSAAGASGRLQQAAGAKKAKLDYEALKRHGFRGGPSVLHVPAPRASAEQQAWDWANGEAQAKADDKESFGEREKLRAAVNEGSMQAAALAIQHNSFAKQQRKDAAEERRQMSFSQKEKRKRDLGQASRGKNYVEEEKRLLRDSGVYSGFDA